MTDAGASAQTRPLAVKTSRNLSDSSPKRRSVRSPASKHWRPPEGLAPDEILAIVAAATTERDRLLLRVLWATGARISEALALRLMDVRRDSLVLPNLKNASRLTKRVFLPAGQIDLPGRSYSGQRSMGSRTVTHSSTRGSVPRVAGRMRSAGSRLGKSFVRPWSAPVCVSWRFALQRTAGWASPLPYILTCSATRGCGRSCAQPRVCRSLRSRPAGHACKRLT
jgi:integrase